MEEWDVEDYLEEVKFMLTEYEEMTKEIILDWEAKARKWISKNSNRKYISKKSADDISIMVKDEDIMYKLALKYHNAYRKNTLEEYWEEFDVV